MYDLRDTLLVIIPAAAVYFSPLFSSVRAVAPQYLKTVSWFHAWFAWLTALWLVFLYIFLSDAVREAASHITLNYRGRRYASEFVVYWSGVGVRAAIETFMHLMPGVVIYTALRNHLGKFIASLVSITLCLLAFEFGHYKLGSPTHLERLPVSIASGFLFSCLLLIALRQQSIWTPIVFHILWNGTIFIIFMSGMERLNEEELLSLGQILLTKLGFLQPLTPEELYHLYEPR